MRSVKAADKKIRRMVAPFYRATILTEKARWAMERLWTFA
jgi:hypothetical protein